MPLIFISACGLTLYYYGTLNAMSQGNLSIYYPIVRSSPIAIFIFSWLFQDTEYTDLTVFAIFLIVIGAIMLQKSKFGFFVNNKALLFALMAMMGSAAYSLSDAIAVQKIKPSVLLFYCYILVSLFLFAIFLRNRRGNQSAMLLLCSQFKLDIYRISSAGSAGVVSYYSYYLILIAFELGGDAAVVSAIRQASIPISVLLAAYLLRENETLKRLGWALLIAAGIIILSIAD